VAALLARERTGRGQRIDVSLFRTAFVDQAAEMLLHDGAQPSPAGGRDFAGPAAGRRIYACRDGWLCVAVGTPEEAAALGRLAGAPIALDAPADGAAAESIARVLAELSVGEAVARLTAARVPAAPCLGFMELLADPWLRARGSIAESSHPTLGPLLMSGPFIRFAATPCTLGRSAPLLGADGAEVLAEVGYAAERIAALVESGIVGRPA
jgi:crotonobetainyl-CoA:carnitine CoA-transferase CaiB-like acyl-CoA transferase